METVISALIIAAIWSLGYVLGAFFTVKQVTVTVKEIMEKLAEMTSSDNSKPF